MKKRAVPFPGDCINPACPYRAEVLGRKEKQRKRVAAWRRKKKREKKT